jgi:membrane complex biogenesis BtpA family protein
MTTSPFLDGRKALIGMVHLPPLPGSTNYAGQLFDHIVEQAVSDACALADAGFDAAIVQNTHDLPATASAPPETVGFLAAIGREISKSVDLPLGINILKNDAEGSLAVAAATGAIFVRLKVFVGAALGAEGMLSPSAPAALRMRQRLGTQTELWIDLFDRTSVPLVAQPLGQLAEWAIKFGGAAALIVTGGTSAESVQMIRQARDAGSAAPVLVGGGVNHHNVAEILREADAVIVGSALEERPFTGPVSADRAREFVRAARTV